MTVKQKAIYSEVDHWLVEAHALVWAMNLYAFIMTAFMYSKSIGLDSSTSGSL